MTIKTMFKPHIVKIKDINYLIFDECDDRDFDIKKRAMLVF